jgi:hypothetical protein
MLYRGYVRKHISPLLGHLKVGELAETMDGEGDPQVTVG